MLRYYQAPGPPRLHADTARHHQLHLQHPEPAEESLRKGILIFDKSLPEIVCSHKVVASLTPAHEFIGTGIPSGDCSHQAGNHFQTQDPGWSTGKNAEIQGIAGAPDRVEHLVVANLVASYMLHGQTLQNTKSP